MTDLSDFAHYFTTESKEKLHQSTSNTSLSSGLQGTIQRNSSVKEFIQIVANWSSRDDEEIDIQWIPFDRPSSGSLTIRNSTERQPLKIDTQCKFYIQEEHSPQELSIDETAESLFIVQPLECQTNVGEPTTPVFLPIESHEGFGRSDSKMGIQEYQKKRSKSVDYSGLAPPSPKGYLTLFKKDKFDPCHLAYKYFQKVYRDTALTRVQSFIRSRSSIDIHYQRKRSESGPQDLDAWRLPLEKPSRLERVKSTLSIKSNLSKFALFRRESKLNSPIF